MIRFFLTAKHYVLFVATWGIGLAISPFVFQLATVDPKLDLDIKSLFLLFSLMMTLFVIGIFGWLYSVSWFLWKHCSKYSQQKFIRFRLAFLYVIGLFSLIIIFIVFVAFGFSLGQKAPLGGVLSGLETILIFLFVVIILGYYPAVFYILRFAAKALVSFELKRKARFGDYIVEFFLFWFMPIGVWFLQSRINRAYAALTAEPPVEHPAS